MPASQDYRDGASTATHELRRRLVKGLSWGFPLTAQTIDAVAEELCGEYGGKVPDEYAERKPVDASEES